MRVQLLFVIRVATTISSVTINVNLIIEGYDKDYEKLHTCANLLR